MALNEDELKSVIKFREMVADFVPTEKLQDDQFLIRWLRARDMDMEKAKCMLQNSMEWFEKNELDKILDWKPKTNNYRFGMAGHDAEGCPVFLLPIGPWKLHELSDKDDLDFMHRCLLKMYASFEHEIKLASLRFGKHVTQAIVIIDLERVAYLRIAASLTLCQFTIGATRAFEPNFPEILKNGILLNSTRLFPLLLRLIKPFISSRTMKKVEIYSSPPRNWIPALEAKVPMEILPPHYGGTRSGNDENCSDDTTLWNEGEPLPAHYFQGTRPQE